MINKRLLHIIRILLKQNTYVTIAELSNELNVSYKTIANDLKTVEAWLTEHGLELIKKTGVGVNIEGSNEIKLSVYQFISRKSKENIDYSPKARMIYIGMKLLLESTCRVHELADDLFVSRATVHKDIHSLTAIFESYKIDLLRKNNNGITISGSEKNFRNCLIELMKIDNGYHIFYEMVKNTNYPCDGSFPFLGLDVNDDEFVEFLKVLENINSKYLHTLLFDSLVQVLHHLFVSFVRIKENHLIHLSESFLQELKFQPYYDDVYEICKAIENYYSIQYSEMEIRYLQVFFLSLKNTNEIRTDDRVDAQEITTSLINEWEKMLPYHLSKDAELTNSLYTHFCSAITRYRHGIVIENQLIDEIKLKYQHTFSIVKESMYLIENKFHCKISEEEMGLLTLHLAVALDKMKQPLTTLLICHEGSGANHLLLRKLQSQFSNELFIKDSQNYPTIDMDQLQHIDLILSTINLEIHADIPIIEINPLLSKYDIARLRDSLTPYYEHKNDHMLAFEKQ